MVSKELDKVVYTFSYVDKTDDSLGGSYPLETQHVKTSVFESCCTWDCVLNDFIRFLEGIYGYNISDNVEITTQMEKLQQEFNKRFEDEQDDDHDHALSTT